jgi:hypothetical protein
VPTFGLQHRKQIHPGLPGQKNHGCQYLSWQTSAHMQYCLDIDCASVMTDPPQTIAYDCH